MTSITLRFPEQLGRRDLQRRNDYKANLAFYEGKQWPTGSRRNERRLTLNYVDIIIQRAAALLLQNNKLLIDQTAEVSDVQAAHAEQLILDVASHNQLAALDYETEVDCSVLGDAAYKVTWDQDTAQVRITSPDVHGLWAWWRQDNSGHLLQVAQQYTLDAEQIQDLFDVTPAKPTATVTERWTSEILELWLNDQVMDTQANAYGFVPYVIFPNQRRPKQFWGQSDIPIIQDTAKELNRELSTLSAIMELSGNPIAALSGVTGSKDIAIAPGAIWNLPEGANASILDLLSKGGVRVHLDYLGAIYRTLHDLAETPRSAFGDLGRSISGVAMELDMAPLVQKINRKRAHRAVAYQRRAALALKLLAQNGKTPDLDYRPRVQWGTILPADRTRLVADEVSLVGAGIHARSTAADAFGVQDPEKEFAAWLQEQTHIEQNSAQRSETNGRQPAAK